MPRLPRLHVPGAFYHVTARGNHREKLFTRPADRRLLDGIVADALKRTESRLHAYCWMTNHLHLLVQVSERPLGILMQRVGTRFARAVQRQIPTTGHLFENRYHALLVDADAYFLELLRYIHLNPVRAGMVATADDYRWSSHGAYTGRRPQSWVTTDFGLSLFNSELCVARRLYAGFVGQGSGASRNASPFEGHPDDKRILGNDAFLSRLAIPLISKDRGTTLAMLAEQLCEESGVSVAELRGPSRARHLAQIRNTLAMQAIDRQIASLSSVARYLNRSVSTLSRAADRARRNANVQT